MTSNTFPKPSHQDVLAGSEAEAESGTAPQHNPNNPHNPHNPNISLFWMTISFFAVGIPYWMIQKPNLPDAILHPGMLLVTFTAFISCVRGALFWNTTFQATAIVIAAVFARVLFDGLQDSTSHNLWPLELMIAVPFGLICAAPGALVGKLLAKVFVPEKKLTPHREPLLAHDSEKSPALKQIMAPTRHTTPSTPSPPSPPSSPSINKDNWPRHSVGMKRLLWSVILGSAGTLPLLLYIQLGPADGNPVGLGLLAMIAFPAGIFGVLSGLIRLLIEYLVLRKS